VSGQLHAPAALPPGKEPPIYNGKEAVWTAEPVWTTWRNKNSCPHRDSISDSLVVQPVIGNWENVKSGGHGVICGTL
jgi:hypothetical protein